MAANPVVTKVECPEGKYYDSGVENCESCDDYCKYTGLPSYVKLCEEYCPKVYKQLMDRQKQPVVDRLTSSTADHSAFPVAGIIALAVVGTLAVIGMVIAGIVVYKRRVQNHNQRPQRATDNRSQCRYSGVEEENGEQAECERLTQGEGLLGALCDARMLLPLRGVAMQETGQEGRNEMALIGSSQESDVSQTPHLKTFAVTQSPIYKPSGHMHSVPTRV